ncbi:MAG: HemK/PrmC family methyltransferase [Pelistega sp.]|nr:HemK/PrmC family methyltransferase [Pelistega sp.]
MLTLAQYFKQSGLPLSEARMLVAELLQVSRAWMITHDDYVLSQEQLGQLQSLTQRRIDGEPMAYILGEREFMGLSFATSPAVLIPRPDTELLVETALAYLAKQELVRSVAQTDILHEEHVLDKTGTCKQGDAHVQLRQDEGFGAATQSNSAPLDISLRVLDMGTGSGAIAISIAHYHPSAQVLASDFSSEALALAQRNAHTLQLKNVDFVLSDWFKAIPAQAFDLIVTNPPYIHKDDEHLQQGDLRYEPQQALTDFADGLSAIRQIIAGAPAYLKLGAPLWIEHGWDQAEAVRELLVNGGFVQVESRQDLAGIERISGGFFPASSSTD